MSIVIGIDLGTANSCVSVIREGKPEVIPDKEGRKTTPSIFAIDSNQEHLVGYPAGDQADTNRLNTIFAVKRLIGRKFDSDHVREAIKKLPYQIIAAENGDAWVEVDETPMSPEEVSGHILAYLKRVAEEFLGEEVRNAVITVPAHFNDAERQATRDAGRIAGLNVLNIINEPTAAALAYGLDSTADAEEGDEEEKIIAVFDLGGGTFDISILGLRKGLFDVKATGGDTYLGGEDFDLAIVNYLLEEFKKKEKVDLTQDKMAMERLKQAAKKAKHDLSAQSVTEIKIENLSSSKGGSMPASISLKFDQKTLERVTGHLLVRLEEPCLDVLEQAGLSPAEVDEVILVGGTTRMPLVRKHCKRIFGKEPNDGINPDTAVACGAAVQGGLLQGVLAGMSLADVTPLSIGIETQGAMVETLIPRNTKVPARVTEIFTTSSPFQQEINFHVLQGESEFAPENKTLGYFSLKGIQSEPRGKPEIAVTVEVDNDGIVHLSAKDLKTGREEKIEIIAASGLSETELNKLVRENRQYESEKERRSQKAAQRSSEAEGTEATTLPSEPDTEEGKRAADSPELIEARNALRQVVFSTQFHLDLQGKRFKGEKRARLEEALKSARAILDSSSDSNEVAAHVKAVSEAAIPLEEHLELEAA